MSESRATSEDVAQLAGVAQSTVSRVFSNSSRISEATRQKVLEAASHLGYRPNNLARSLITKQSLLIGIVMAGIDTAFSPYVLEKLTLRLQADGYKVLLFNVGQALSADDLLPAALDYQVDGLITTSAIVSDEMVEVCARFKTPLILFNRRIKNETINTVNADDYGGGSLAAKAMMAAGIQHPAFISGPTNTSTSQDRRQGFVETLAEQGYAPPIESLGDLSYDSAFQATRELMRHPNKPDGFFAASDLMAMGVLDALRYELGYQIPETIQVIGFDDIPAAAHLAYQLTTIRLDVDLMINETLEILKRHLQQKSQQIEQITTPVVYVERKTLVRKH
ncbi:MAG: LacI family DNA-binding transcriptional regulator [Chloroflexota bacterium]